MLHVLEVVSFVFIFLFPILAGSSVIRLCVCIYIYGVLCDLINKITFSQICFSDMKATLAKGVRREKKALINLE